MTTTPTTPTPGLVITARTRVRYAETDQMGVVWHGHYVAFMEIGRTEFMRAIGVPYAAVEAAGNHLVIVDLSMRLRAPARYDVEIAVHTRITSVRHTSVTFGYEIELADDGTRLVSGETRLGCLDATTRRPCAMPDSLGNLLRACLPAEPTQG